ncbi:MAG: hypothetical protein M3154_00520 [Candidatus Eremiobacteraeota bacterium]|nr:hypothetical protein [Candidatus Eremiobacteraeota bacterium]
MPRPKTPAVTYHQLVARLGQPARERAEFIPLDGAPIRPPHKVHRGWSWNCGCASFARDVTDMYLYVACVGHSTPRGLVSLR